MIYAKDLREKQARLATQMRAIVDGAKNDNNRGLRSDEAEKFDVLETDYTQLSASIERAEKADAIDSQLAAFPANRIDPNLTIDPKAARAAADKPHAAAFDKYLRGGLGSLSPEEQKLMQSRYVAANGIQNAQTITTTGGGYLIPQGFSDQLEEAMKWYGGIIGNVEEFTTETGAQLPWPTTNDTAQKGRILGVNTQLTETDFSFSQVTFTAYIGTSDSVLVPLALLQDSYFDLNSYTARKLGERLGRLVNNKCTVGSGTNEPTGIQTAVIAAGNTVQGAIGETTSIIYDDLVNTLHLVDPAYRQDPSCKWMFSDSTLKVLRKLKDSQNRPLWQPGITAGFGNGFPETILDKPYAINQDMPGMAASAYPILFGALSKYKLRRVAGGVTIMRLAERYADYLQMGFLAFLRFDGNLIDAGTHPIAAFQNSAT